MLSFRGVANALKWCIIGIMFFRIGDAQVTYWAYYYDIAEADIYVYCYLLYDGILR